MASVVACDMVKEIRFPAFRSAVHMICISFSWANLLMGFLDPSTSGEENNAKMSVAYMLLRCCCCCGGGSGSGGGWWWCGGG